MTDVEWTIRHPYADGTIPSRTEPDAPHTRHRRPRDDAHRMYERNSQDDGTHRANHDNDIHHDHHDHASSDHHRSTSDDDHDTHGADDDSQRNHSADGRSPRSGEHSRSRTRTLRRVRDRDIDLDDLDHLARVERDSDRMEPSQRVSWSHATGAAVTRGSLRSARLVMGRLVDGCRSASDGRRGSVSRERSRSMGAVIERRKPLERRTPLARESARTRSRKGERASAKAAALARDGGCVAARIVRTVACRGPLDGHERLPRSRGGSAYDIENIITVCRIHHGWIHAHPKEARSHGLLV